MATGRLDITWDGGERATIGALDGEEIKLVSTRPFAPGSRPTGTLDGGFAIRLKVHRSKKIAVEAATPPATEADAPPKFAIEGRLLEARRDLLAEIRARLEPPRPDE
ncbi:MAG TPA: hypothetical protein VL400_18380 [Polyangiaceae bacterium]|jgi:hypothetical protein|nr:hypothetical protein [Polyangiaceae bacterium]